MNTWTVRPRAQSIRLASLTLLAIAGLVSSASAQRFTVTGQVELITKKRVPNKNRSNVVVWLNPIGEIADAPVPMSRLPVQPARLIQKNKRFEPRILVIPAGTAVEFPNRDPFFHNVFSLFEGKRFDLGLYEAGTTRAVHFDHPGVSYIFCNIHPEMSAAVIALRTPYYAVSDSAGAMSIQDVPAGRYQMQVWYEGSSPMVLKKLAREITISASEPRLGTVSVLEDSPVANHKNKYGRDYDTRITRSSEYGPN
jgi:hypothetical protein